MLWAWHDVISCPQVASAVYGPCYSCLVIPRSDSTSRCCEDRHYVGDGRGGVSPAYNPSRPRASAVRTTSIRGGSYAWTGCNSGCSVAGLTSCSIGPPPISDTPLNNSPQPPIVAASLGHPRRGNNIAKDIIFQNL